MRSWVWLGAGLIVGVLACGNSDDGGASAPGSTSPAGQGGSASGSGGGSGQGGSSSGAGAGSGQAGASGEAGASGAAGEGGSAGAAGGGSKGVSQTCASDAECASGLACVELTHKTGEGCSGGVKACTKTCDSAQGGAGCAQFGASFSCFAGCGGPDYCLGMATSGKGPSQVCAADGECAEGLSCLPFMSGTGGACSPDKKICSKACDQAKGDADCSAFGADFKCLSCGSGSVCVKTAG